jgi:hypothetical protein
LLLKKQPGKAQSAVEVLLHADFQALQQSVHDGCQLYPCWPLALLNGSAPPAMLRRIQECESPEFATSPITISQSRMKPDVVKVAEIHYFQIFNFETKAPMRLGGVTDNEFLVLMGPRPGDEVQWVLERLQSCHKDRKLCSGLRSSQIAPDRPFHFREDMSQLVPLVDSFTLHGVAYVALSYCWGGHDKHILTLTQDNEARLKSGIKSDSLR